MGSIGTTELIIIAFVLVLLFGAKRLPETARGIGRSLKVFKSEIQDDDQNAALANPEAADTEPDTEHDTEHGKSAHAAAESSSQTGPASSGRPTSADVA